MDVRHRVRAIGLILLLANLHLLGPRAQADPAYAVIDLGTAAPTFGTNSSGQGIVTGSNGLSYNFDASQVALPSQGSNTSQGIPNVVAAPVGNGDTYGNPAYAYSNSTLVAENSQGLAAGFDVWGVSGHISNTQAFAVQQQANGSWGTPVSLWAGTGDFGHAFGVGILGISTNGQVLGYGYNLGQMPLYDAIPNGYGLFLYDFEVAVAHEPEQTDRLDHVAGADELVPESSHRSNRQSGAHLAPARGIRRLYRAASYLAVGPAGPLPGPGPGARAGNLVHLRNAHRRLDGPPAASLSPPIAGGDSRRLIPASNSGSARLARLSSSKSCRAARRTLPKPRAPSHNRARRFSRRGGSQTAATPMRSARPRESDRPMSPASTTPGNIPASARCTIEECTGVALQL